ncbi:MAG: hypothetical protein M0P01_14070, partial [Treponema sp.]|nr:hypothetical protein [Treponema sp.]
MKRYGTSFLLITAMLLCTSCSGLKTYHLKNGIPVYVKNDTGKKIDAVYIVVKGGVALLKPEQSGFEEAVFTDMTYASGHFTDTERTQLLNQTRSSILCASGENGSSLRLECIDSYLYKDIPVFTDSFMHPVFNRELF